ncbi:MULTISPECIES: mechanosensitive ion channel family protein [Flavobacterium]|jgi:small conductance mechanosensitive channel|uniref:Small conductance mechanosensitive channel n=2 Tax=Flavobacterium johnsoniae TaxID=986 RepID=A0A1M5G3S5_FLAJO|nr:MULTISPECIES: mechanosensitive ion channel domain-containing protein [Flavobacterium]ABQ04706.1 MscS Mechanosensitive ion channel [Flavobacterium johnsoniae UW101]OXE96450.1 mechanosensitive ion channel protein [Flavobacterium johnsoniae UW101]WDF60416.1 mechanosensitive ion channel [Flavobacterium sp. KACC 22758]WQG83497.1 mechanosensitive ion channel [Flavobacterium johnsoniae UW101]SHF98373.1 small conductance mechanosensitive channel [Flavobacterium johnsoniae]
MYINPEQLSSYAAKFINLLIDYSPKLISAFLVLFVGLYAIKFINRIIRKIMEKRNLDPTLTKFLADILLWALRILLFVTFISNLGIETSSFVAILGAMGLAVGLSLQGSLSNFAGGMLIIVFKPFKVGDTIEAQGVIATVLEIQIFVTKMLTGNNQTVFVPNGALSNGTIINYSMQGERRADLTFSVSYDSDIKKAKDILLEVLNKNPKVLQKPAPEVFVKNLSASSVDFAVRPWAKNANYGAVFSETLEDCKTALDQAGISVQPFTLQK